MRRSASVSSPRDGARPPMRASSPRVCAAQSGAPSGLEARQVRPRASRGRGPLLGSALGPAEGEQRARVVERIDAPCVLGERPIEGDERTVEVSAGREQQPATAGEDRERPGPVESVGALLSDREDLFGLFELSDSDQRLEQVSQLDLHSRLVRAHLVPSGGGPSQMGECRSGVSEREVDEAEHPAVPRRGHACELGVPTLHDALGPGARLVDPALVRRDDGRRELVGERLVSELRREAQRLGRVPVGLVPVPGPPLEEAEIPARTRLFERIVSRFAGMQDLLEERPRTFHVSRPPELVPEDSRGAIRERPPGQRPFERERLLHRRGYVPPGVEVQEAVRCEGAAAECNVVNARCGEDGEPAVLEATLDPVTEAHQSGEVEVDGGLERIVPFGFCECFAAERYGSDWARLDVGQLRQHGGALVARRRSSARLLEQVSCAAWVACAELQVGCLQQAPVAIGARRRRQPKRLLGKLGSLNRRAASLRRSRGLLEDRSDVVVDVGCGEREVTSSFLRGRDDIGESCVQRAAA